MLGGIKGGMGAVRERASLQPRLSLPLCSVLHCIALCFFLFAVCSTLNCTALCTSYLIQELFNRAFGFALHCTLHKSCSAFCALLHNRASLPLFPSVCSVLHNIARHSSLYCAVQTSAVQNNTEAPPLHCIVCNPFYTALCFAQILLCFLRHFAHFILSFQIFCTFYTSVDLSSSYLHPSVLHFELHSSLHILSDTGA